MNTIKVNTEVLAKQLSKEIPGIGYAKALDIIAKSVGYSGFRALKACQPPVQSTTELIHRERANAMRLAAQVIELFDDATMKEDHMLDSTECANVIEGLAQREIELADKARMAELALHAKKSKDKAKEDNWETTMFTLPMRAWESAGQTHEMACKELPPYKHVQYEAKVFVSGGFSDTAAPSLTIDITPKGESVTDSIPSDRLSITVEINEGVPCAHITNDALSNVMLSVFGSRDGLLVREGDGTFVHVNRQEPTAEQPVFARLKKHAVAYSHAWFVDNNLAENWDVQPLPAPQELSGPFYVWANESCDNKTHRLEEAIKWAKEFLNEDPESHPYVVDVDNNVVWSPEKA